MNYAFDIVQIAHRGDSHYYKDNTVESFVSALNRGYDIIELDIQLCKSGEIIVFHDTEIEEDKAIIELTFNEILKIDPDVITLEEFFNIPGMKHMSVYLDMKGCQRLSKKLVDFINEKELNTSNIIVASYNLRHLKEVEEIKPGLKLAFITHNTLTNEFYQKLSDDYKIRIVVMHWGALDDESIIFLKFYGMKVYTYTCKNNYVYTNIMKYNVDGIVTNYKLEDGSLL